MASDLATAESIRSGRPATLHDFTASSDEDMAAMLRGMHPGAVRSSGGADAALRHRRLSIDHRCRRRHRRTVVRPRKHEARRLTRYFSRWIGNTISFNRHMCCGNSPALGLLGTHS
jgi:hypothetical protein